MTLKKAYMNITITLLLVISSIILFVLQIASNYVFWYHVVFYIGAAVSILLSIMSIYLLSIKTEKTYERLFETIDWFSFTLQSLLVILMMFMFFFFSSTVKQSSMYPTLEEGNIVIASQFLYEPARGDIVIVHVDPNKHPGEEDKLLVKRIAAMPGDLVTFSESPSEGGYKILINGEIYTHDGITYIARYVASEKAAMEASLDVNGYVKEGEYLVFGDNEANSKDSRNLGTFDYEDIIGHVVFRIWPIGGLS